MITKAIAKQLTNEELILKVKEVFNIEKNYNAYHSRMKVIMNNEEGFLLMRDSAYQNIYNCPIFRKAKEGDVVGENNILLLTETEILENIETENEKWNLITTFMTRYFSL